jgi:hypothetical protein
MYKLVKIKCTWLVNHSIDVNVLLTSNFCTGSVATLALGSRPRQELAKVRAKSEPESHISCSWECKRV